MYRCTRHSRTRPTCKSINRVHFFLRRPLLHYLCISVDVTVVFAAWIRCGEEPLQVGFSLPPTRYLPLCDAPNKHKTLNADWPPDAKQKLVVPLSHIALQLEMETHLSVALLSWQKQEPSFGPKTARSSCSNGLWQMHKPIKRALMNIGEFPLGCTTRINAEC